MDLEFDRHAATFEFYTPKLRDIHIDVIRFSSIVLFYSLNFYIKIRYIHLAAMIYADLILLN